MGLFGKNKKLPTKTASKAEIDDIFTKPVNYKQPSNELITDVKVNDETSVTPTTFNGPRGINAKTLEKSMAALEIELSEREKRVAKNYSMAGITKNDISNAEIAFEDTVSEISERQSRERYGRINAAITTDIDNKIKELDEKYDYLVHKPTEKIDYGFNSISEEEFNSILSQYDIEKAAQRRAIINNMPGLNDEQKMKIEKFFEDDVKAKPIDFVNTIPELKEKDLEIIKRQIEEIYGLNDAEKTKLEMETL